VAEVEVRPSKTFRGTWEHILNHSDEIPNAAEVEVRVFEPVSLNDPSIALLELWLANAPTEAGAIQAAEDDLRDFKRHMNVPRKEAGARLHYPEVE